ncbi:MAG: LPS export ABC transporter periplasmic protein LptC [Candidatus Krumholzibacteriia bacterium]
MTDNRRAAGVVRAWPAACLALCLILAAAGCDREPERAAGPAAVERVPEQEIMDYRLIQSEAGVRRWTLTSERMRKYPDQEEVELDEPHMEFYRDGAYYSTLTARHGRANLDGRNMFAQGGVVVVTSDGRRLETEELRYDNATGRITNTVFNRFTRGADVVTGYGLDASPGLEHFQLRSRVAAEVSDTLGTAAPAGRAP